MADFVKYPPGGSGAVPGAPGAAPAGPPVMLNLLNPVVVAFTDSKEVLAVIGMLQIIASRLAAIGFWLFVIAAVLFFKHWGN